MAITLLSHTPHLLRGLKRELVAFVWPFLLHSDRPGAVAHAFLLAAHYMRAFPMPQDKALQVRVHASACTNTRTHMHAPMQHTHTHIWLHLRGTSSFYVLVSVHLWSCAPATLFCVCAILLRECSFPDLLCITCACI